MLVHAGGMSGFVNLDSCIFEGTVNVDGDYHKNMNCAVLESWFVKLLDTLSQPTVIVMDNASYHSRKTSAHPTSRWRKEQLKQWLEDHNITFDERMLRE